MAVELVADMYIEIFQGLTDDYASVVSWFLSCKHFQRMVPGCLIRKYTFPTFPRVYSYWDGWLSGFSRFRGREVFCVMSQDRDRLAPRDYPKDVWDKILFESSIEDEEDATTREHCISCEDWQSGKIDWIVRYKRHYRLYTQWDLINTSPCIKDHATLAHCCVGEFTEDEFLQWN